MANEIKSYKFLDIVGAGIFKEEIQKDVNDAVSAKANKEHEHALEDIADLLPVLTNKADKSEGVFYIEGAGTTDTTNKVATWTGSHSDITKYFVGLTVLYKVATVGSTTTTLNVNNLGAVPVVRNATTGISTAVPVDAVVLLTYTIDSDGTAYWKTADYDSNTKNSAGTTNKSDTKMYLVGGTTQSSSVTTYSNKNVYIGKDNHLYSNDTKVSVEGHTHDISDVTDLEDVLNSKVPSSRKVNGKNLTADITLSASDVGAATPDYVDSLFTWGEF